MNNPEAYPSSDPVGKLVEELHKLPGIGPKTAQRLAYHLIRMGDEHSRSLAEAILAVKQRIILCSRLRQHHRDRSVPSLPGLEP